MIPLFLLPQESEWRDGLTLCPEGWLVNFN